MPNSQIEELAEINFIYKISFNKKNTFIIKGFFYE